MGRQLAAWSRRSGCCCSAAPPLAGPCISIEPLRWFAPSRVVAADRRHVRRRHLRDPPRRLCADRRDVRARTLALRVLLRIVKLVLFSGLWLGHHLRPRGFARWQQRAPAPARPAETPRRSAARATQGAAAAAFPLQCPQHDLGADAGRRGARRPAAHAPGRPAAREAAAGAQRHDVAARGAPAAGAVRADHAGALRRSRHADWNIAATRSTAPFPRCCCSRCWRTPSSTASSAAASRSRSSIEARRDGDEAARDRPQHAARSRPSVAKRHRPRATAASGSRCSTARDAQLDARAGGRRRRLDDRAALAAASRMMRVLVADDEAPARDKLRRWLSEQPDVEVVGESADGLARGRGDRTARSPTSSSSTSRCRASAAWKSRRSSNRRRRRCIVFVTALRRARDQGLRAERDRLPAQALRQGSAAQDAVADPRPPGRRSGARRRRDRPRADRLAATVCSCRRARRCSSSTPRSIHWLEADDNYVHVHTAQARYILRRTLQDLLAQLGEQLRAHPQVRGGEHRRGQGPLAAVQGRLRSAAAQRQGAAAEPAVQGRAVRSLTVGVGIARTNNRSMFRITAIII